MLTNKRIREQGACNRNKGGPAAHGAVVLADGKVANDAKVTHTLPTLLRTRPQYWLIELGLTASPIAAMAAQRRAISHGATAPNRPN